eukprot:g4074.t1
MRIITASVHSLTVLAVAVVALLLCSADESGGVAETGGEEDGREVGGGGGGGGGSGSGNAGDDWRALAGTKITFVGTRFTWFDWVGRVSDGMTPIAHGGEVFTVVFPIREKLQSDEKTLSEELNPLRVRPAAPLAARLTLSTNIAVTPPANAPEAIRENFIAFILNQSFVITRMCLKGRGGALFMPELPEHVPDIPFDSASSEYYHWHNTLDRGDTHQEQKEYICSGWQKRDSPDMTVSHHFMPLKEGIFTAYFEMRNCIYNQICSNSIHSTPFNFTVTTRERIILDVFQSAHGIDVMPGSIEFSMELALIVPYAHYLKRVGKLRSVTSFSGIRDLYFFVSDDEYIAHEDVLQGHANEHPGTADRLPKLERIGQGIGLDAARGLNPHIWGRSIDDRMWSPPDYRRAFGRGGDKSSAALERVVDWMLSTGFSEAKPLLIVHNRASDAIRDLLPAGSRMPFMSAASVDFIFRHMLDTHRIVYFGELSRNASGMLGYTMDAEERQSLHERDVAAAQRNANIAKVLAAYPQVVQFNMLFPQIADNFQNLTSFPYNTVQMAIHSRCSRFISVSGGSAIVASYFGGTNIIMTANTDPFKSIGGFYSRFAGSTIVPVSTDAELQKEVVSRFV